ncbi:MAG: carboxypeptidase regulatory-like domain-containing protein, partial [Planctomycetes bacterium]|nr:carboxypeptidase regulatory-like domain-containing protein [Planctomycetota bacterium]
NPQLEPLATAVTDAAGQFRIPARVGWPSHCAIVTEAPGYTRVRRAGVTVAATIAVRLDPLYELAGRVTARVGDEPLAGAIVRCGAATAVTGDDGHFEISAIGVAGAVYLDVACDGYADERVSLQLHDRAPTEVDVALRRLTSILVEVVDGVSRRPIAGIEARTFGGELAATTDAGGRFAWDVALGVCFELRLGGAGYATVAWRWDVDEIPAEPLRLPMLAAATVAGTVRDASGMALAAATLSVTLEDDPFGNADLWPGLRREFGLPGALRFAGDEFGVARSDQDGRYRIEVPPDATPYRVVARHQGLPAHRSPPIDLHDPGAIARVDFELRRGGTVAGRVLRNGEPWRGTVLWQAATPDTEICGGTHTDENGHYELREVHPGAVEIVLREPSGALGRRVEVTVESDAGLVQDFAWDETNVAITGRVTFEAGGPAEHVAVHAVEFGDHGARSYRGTTDRDGRYAIEVPPGRVLLVSVWHAGLRRELENVTAGATDVDFLLPRLGTLRLRLVDADSGEPIRTVRDTDGLVAWRQPGARAFETARRALDSAGLVELALPLGRVDVSLALQPLGYAPLVVQGLLVTANADPSPRVVRVVRGVDVTLVIAAPEAFAAAVPGHIVFLLERSQLDSLRGPFPRQGPPSNHRIGGVCMWVEEPGLLAQQLHPRDDGEAAFTGLLPGRYRVVAYPGDLVFTPSEFDVDARSGRIRLAWARR